MIVELLNEDDMQELAGCNKEFYERTKGTDETWDSTKTFDFAFDNGWSKIYTDKGEYLFFKEVDNQ